MQLQTHDLIRIAGLDTTNPGSMFALAEIAFMGAQAGFYTEGSTAPRRLYDAYVEKNNSTKWAKQIDPYIDSYRAQVSKLNVFIRYGCREDADWSIVEECFYGPRQSGRSRYECALAKLRAILRNS